MNKLPRMNVIRKQAAVALEDGIAHDQLDTVQGGQVPGIGPGPGIIAPMYGTPLMWDRDRLNDLLQHPPTQIPWVPPQKDK